MALRRISVRNLRSLASKQSFDLGNLVLAVGANSTGKSTFLKLLPLLRQSTETTTKGPILWYGKYVDFGLFDSAVSRGAENSEIEFGFDLDLLKTDQIRPNYSGPTLNFLEDGLIQVSLVVASSSRGLTYTKKLALELFGRRIEVHADDEGSVGNVTLDGESVPLGTAKAELLAENGLFTMNVRRKRLIQTPKGTTEMWLGSNQDSLIPAKVLSYVKALYHGRTGPDKTRHVANRLGIGRPKVFLDHLRHLASNTQTSLDAAYALTAASPWLKELSGFVLVDRLPVILYEINQVLVRIFSGTRYMGPVRAVAQRYYRLQDLSVNEVDPAGENLPMFLMGLSPAKREEFSTWCEENIGFRLKTKIEGAHVSLLLSESQSGESFNIADMGFGYSQILPLLATIWLGISDSKRPSAGVNLANSRRGRFLIPGGGVTVVIEQPELHLHPHMQAHFADLLVSVAKTANNLAAGVRIICETHSETIVNRIGTRIGDGFVDPTIAHVYLFEKNAHSGTTVTKAEYDDEGVLRNWPFGFFTP